MFPKLIANTRLRVAFVLSLIWIVYFLFNVSFRAFFMPLFSIGLVVAFDSLITYLRKRKLYLPASSLVTGLLIGLILAPGEPLYVFVFASALAVFSKQVIRTREHQHILNPAAFGIVATSLLLNVPVAWWAVSWSPWTILLAIGASYTLYKLKRLWLPITFLFTYSTYLGIFGGGRAVASFLLDGTVFLFAFIMLPEPITSPAQGKWKYGFGLLIALFASVFGRLTFLPDVFLPALLLGNLIGFLQKENLRFKNRSFPQERMSSLMLL